MYCWWLKSCTSWYGESTIICRVWYISGGAGFLPSTVSSPSLSSFLCLCSCSSSSLPVATFATHSCIIQLIHISVQYIRVKLCITNQNRLQDTYAQKINMRNIWSWIKLSNQPWCYRRKIDLWPLGHKLQYLDQCSRTWTTLARGQIPKKGLRMQDGICSLPIFFLMQIIRFRRQKCLDHFWNS